MITLKQGFNQEEKRFIENVLYNVVDLLGDFYVTSQNIRIFLRDNPEVLFNYLRKGDKIAFDAQNETGLAIVTGWSDKSPRKYVKVLTKDEKLAGDLLKMIVWNTKCDLYAKIKKNSPLIKVFQRNGYIFKGDRGSEILYYHKYIPRPEARNMKDEEQYDRVYKKKI